MDGQSRSVTLSISIEPYASLQNWNRVMISWGTEVIFQAIVQDEHLAKYVGACAEQVSEIMLASQNAR